MKKIIIASILAAAAFGASAQSTYVNGHTRSDGTYVPGHYRSAPDGNRYNNYSTQGNVNPYTGQQGTVQPHYTPPNNNYLNQRYDSKPSYLNDYRQRQR